MNKRVETLGGYIEHVQALDLKYAPK